MRKLLIIVALLWAVGMALPTFAAEKETLDQGIERIVALYEQQDFNTLIRERYAEIGKAEDESQIERLVERFETMFSDDERRAQAIEVYRGLLDMEPERSDDGNEAVFRPDGGWLKLSRMPDGRWGFHL